MNTPRVLVVEDDARTARFFAAAADRLGFEAQVARTGDEAIVYLAETVPDLILLDLRLPGISGWEILPQIRADPRLAGTPVIVVTMYPHLLGDLQEQADLVLVKPITYAHLREAIQRSQAARPEAPDAGPSPPLAFVIEDDEDAVVIFSEALRRAGFNSEVIRSGDQALERLAVEAPQLVLLDLQLPAASGAEVLSRIRADARLANTTVIVVTAHPAMLDDLSTGPDATLIKPASFTQLRKLCERLGHGCLHPTD